MVVVYRKPLFRGLFQSRILSVCWSTTGERPESRSLGSRDGVTETSFRRIRKLLSLGDNF